VTESQWTWLDEARAQTLDLCAFGFMAFAFVRLAVCCAGRVRRAGGAANVMDGERADLIGADVAAIGIALIFVGVLCATAFVVARLRHASSAMPFILTNHPEKFAGRRGCRP